MMAYIMFGLAKQFDPPQVQLHINPSTYTNQAFKDLERESMKYKLKWQEADAVIMDILKVEKVWQ